MGNTEGLPSGMEDKMPDVGLHNPVQYRHQRSGGGTWERSALLQEERRHGNWLRGQTRLPSGQPPHTASQILAITEGTETNKNLNSTHIVQISASNEENTILLFPEFSKTVFKIISKNRFMSKYVDKLPSHTPSYMEGRKETRGRDTCWSCSGRLVPKTTSPMFKNVMMCFPEAYRMLQHTENKQTIKSKHIFVSICLHGCPPLVGGADQLTYLTHISCTANDP